MSRWLLLIPLLLLVNCDHSQNRWLVQSPARDRYCQVQINGQSVLPTGRLIQPFGNNFSIAPFPIGMALSPDGSAVAISHAGNQSISISILQNIQSPSPQFQQLPSGALGHPDHNTSGRQGLAIHPSRPELFVSGGASNLIYRFHLKTGEKLGELNCSFSNEGADYLDGYISELCLSRDGLHLYALDEIGGRLLIMDTKRSVLLANIPAGRQPVEMVLSPDESTMYIANLGQGQATFLEEDQPDALNLPEPSREIWAIDMTLLQIQSKIQLGGQSPCKMICGEKYLYISEETQDQILKISRAENRILQKIDLSLDSRIQRYYGLQPKGLALSTDQKRLFISAAGLNAVGVLDTRTARLIGHIPVGWQPGELAINPDGSNLVLLNYKGLGSGPENTCKGSLSILEIPDDRQLEMLSRDVLRFNFDFFTSDALGMERYKKSPVPLFPEYKKSPIRHIVYIRKESFGFSQVLRQLDGAKGVEQLAKEKGRIICARQGSPCLEGVDVMPNHLALSRQFACSDNFYHPSIAEGHPNVSELLGHLEAHGIPYWNVEDHHLGLSQIDEFGFEANRIPVIHSNSEESEISAGSTEQVFLDEKDLSQSPCDQFQVSYFEQTFREKWMNGTDSLPPFIHIRLGDEHIPQEAPEKGFPFRESYQADHDLALGRMVEFLCHTPYWPHMAIIITESQKGNVPDPVDGHRSILMVVSPFAKKQHISHTHSNPASIYKTIWNILGIPYINQWDAGANDLSDLFDHRVDESPYHSIQIDPRLFDPQKVLIPMLQEQNVEASEVL